MSKVNSRTNGLKKLEPFHQAQAFPPAVFIDRQAFYILHDDVRQSVVSDASVQQSDDIGMFERRQDLTFFFEAAQGFRGWRYTSDQLDGDVFRELSVVTLAQVHGRHAA